MLYILCYAYYTILDYTNHTIIHYTYYPVRTLHSVLYIIHCTYYALACELERIKYCTYYTVHATHNTVHRSHTIQRILCCTDYTYHTAHTRLCLLYYTRLHQPYHSILYVLSCTIHTTLHMLHACM